ncbi:MAG: hypothetical protein ABJ251_07030 [Paracoccaceae bacterium]
MTTENTTPADDKDAANLASFLEKVTPTIAESVMKSIDAKVEERLAGIAAKNAELLGKLQASKTETSSVTEQLAALSKQIADGPAPVTEVTIGKADARDPRKYAAAKAKAEEAGVTLQIDRDK